MRKGDTLIEVILAFSVFSAAMMGGLWLMNNAMARTQASLQLTMARNAIDGQAEALRYFNSRHLSISGSGASDNIWNAISGRAVNSPSALNICPENGNFPSRAFAINIRGIKTGEMKDNEIITGNLARTDTYPRLAYNGLTDSNQIDSHTAWNQRFNSRINNSQGLWIEAVRANAMDNFIDFHIRACWDTPGQNAPTTLGTIVRLYNAD